MKELDPGFIGRVYRTSAWFCAVMASLVGVTWGAAAAWGLLAGCALNLGCLRGIELGVRRVIRPGVVNAGPLWLYLFGLYPPLLLALWLVVRSHWFNLPAFAAGIALPNLVIFLKAVGPMVNRATGAEPGGIKPGGVRPGEVVPGEVVPGESGPAQPVEGSRGG